MMDGWMMMGMWTEWQFKAKGNKALQEKNFDEAIKFYSQVRSWLLLLGRPYERMKEQAGYGDGSGLDTVIVWLRDPLREAHGAAASLVIGA